MKNSDTNHLYKKTAKTFISCARVTGVSFGLVMSFVIGAIVLGASQANAQSRSGKVTSAVYVASRSGVLFDFGIYYGQAESTARPSYGNEFKNNISIYDIKLGYITDENWYLGGVHTVRNDSGLVSTESSSGSGVGLGYFFSNNFNIRAFYKMNETYGDYQEGSGVHADLEYKVNFASSFYIGAAISHRQITFKQNDTLNQFEDYTMKNTFPIITLGFIIN